MNYNKILTGMAAVVAVAFGFSSCSEEVEVNNPSSNQNLSIGVSIHQGWDDPQPTRAARFESSYQKMQAAGVKDVIAFNEPFEGKPIYLHCDAIDGFEGKGHTVAIESSADVAEETRGTLMNGHDGSSGQGREHFVKESFYDNFNIFGTDAPENGALATWKHDNEWSVSGSVTWGSNTFYGVAPANATGVSEASNTSFKFTTRTNSVEQIDLMVGPSEQVNARHILFKFQHVLSAVRFKLGSDFSKGYTIKKISLTNVKTTNTYTFGSGWGSPSNAQIVYAEGLDFSTTDGANELITKDGSPNNPSDVGKTFIVMPQTLESGAYAVVSLYDDNNPSETLTFYASLEGQTWEQGYAYTYTISNTPYKPEFTFTVTTDPTFDYAGNVMDGKGSFKVTSYRKEGPTKTPTPIAWQVTGYEVSNNGTSWTSVSAKPKWLEEMTESGSGDTGSGTSCAPVVDSQSAVEENFHRRQGILRNLDEKGTEANPLDLSLYKVDNTTAWSGRTTANCYIVRQGGYYKIPLVMGNTIKKGAINAPESYSVANATYNFRVNVNQKGNVVDGEQRYRYKGYITGSYVTGTQTFVDYLDNLVTATNYKVNAASAEVLWHDFQHTEKGTELSVIKDVSITTDGADGLVDKFVKFRVDKETIQQGNAVIAVKDDLGRIMWSWQIYITDHNWNTEVTNIVTPAFHVGPTGTDGADIPSTNIAISNYNLGYVERAEDGTTHTYPTRYIRVTFRQAETGEEVKRIITQHGVTINVEYKCHWDTKYQWGRKDALPGTVLGGDSYGSPAEQAPFYCKYYPWGSYVKRDNVEGGSTYGRSIQNPLSRLHILDGSTVTIGGGWAKKFYVNAWDAKQKQAVTNQKAGVNTRAPQGLDYPHVVVSNVTKTIYDPCPAGFKMPPSGAFTRFTKSGGSQSGGNRNIKDAFDHGYYFYTTEWQTGPTVYFPATGRLADAGLRNYNTQSWVWSATASITTDYWVEDNHQSTAKPSDHTGKAESRHLSFDTSVSPLQTNNAVMPQSVRPMVDND